MVQVNHSNFDKACEYVARGEGEFAIRNIRITHKTLNLITKDKDGRGFLLSRGKKKDYLLPGYLYLVTPGT